VFKKSKLILFDCDGVLVDSEPIAIQSMLDLANPFGNRLSLKEAYPIFTGKSLEYCFQYLEQHIQSKLPDDFVLQYRKLSYERFEKELKAVEGVLDFIKSINDQYAIAVASSGPIEKIELNLSLTGLSPYFEKAIFSCYTIGKFKPDPDIFLYAAKSMGYEIKDCMVIEDSETGVQAALAGQFKVLQYKPFDSNDHSTVPTFRHFNELNVQSFF
jgi:HAD superfamily hydrolase (TIGR01509 family)